MSVFSPKNPQQRLDEVREGVMKDLKPLFDDYYSRVCNGQIVAMQTVLEGNKFSCNIIRLDGGKL